MAVPGSGEIHMKGLHNEKVNDDYNHSSDPGGAVTMHDLVNGGNSQGSAVSYEATNTSGDNEPNTSTPHAFNEWYGYDHDFVAGAPTVPTITFTQPAASTTSLVLNWDMAGDNTRVYFTLVSIDGNSIGSDFIIANQDFKTSAGSQDLGINGSTHKYAGNVPLGSLTPNKSLTVKARGFFDGSFSSFSSNITGFTLPGTPTSLAAGSITTTAMTISWTAPTGGASSYTYYHGTNSSVTSNSSATTTNTSVTFSGLTPNQIYYFAVIAVGGGGHSGTITSTVSQYTKVSTPHSMSTTNITNNSATLNWAAGAGNPPTNYSIYAGTNGAYPNAAGNVLLTSTQTGTSRNQTSGITGNTTFYWWIQANATVPSGYTSATSFLSKPDAPTNATITANSATSITVSWTAPAHGVGTQGYKYHFGTNSTVANNTQYTTTNTSATHTVVGNTRYYLMVAGVNATGTGPFTAPINAYTPPADIDNSTFSLAGTATDKISINFTEPAGGVASYTVKFAVTAPSNTLTTVSPSPTSTPFIVDIGSGIMQQAFFMVQPVGDTGLTGTNTTTVSGGGYIQRYALPAAPSGLSASSITHNSATLSWSAGYNSSGASYKVFVGEDSDQENFDNEYSVSSGTLSLTVSGLSASTLHYFWVQGVNPNGDVASSTLSSAATFTTAAQLIVSSTVHRASGTGRGMTFTVDNNGETISGPNQAAGSTTNLESSIWRVTWSGADATTTSALTIPSGPSIKQASSASSIGGATYTSSPSSLTMSNLKQHYWQLKETVTYMSGQSTVTRNVVVTNNTVSVTIPITWSYFGTFGAGSDRRLKTDVKKIGTSPSGIPIYEFRFKDDLDTLWEGTIAQDLLELGMDDVVGRNEDGFYTVDYDKIDVDQIQVIEIDGK